LLAISSVSVWHSLLMFYTYPYCITISLIHFPHTTSSISVYTLSTTMSFISILVHYIIYMYDTIILKILINMLLFYWCISNLTSIMSELDYLLAVAYIPILPEYVMYHMPYIRKQCDCILWYFYYPYPLTVSNILNIYVPYIWYQFGSLL
jgi:hypothetical protein